MRRSVNRAEYPLIVECLKMLRRNAGLTQVGLAAKLRWKQAYISSVERHYRRIDLLQTSDFVRACGSNMAELGAMIDEAVESVTPRASTKTARRPSKR